MIFYFIHYGCLNVSHLVDTSNIVTSNWGERIILFTLHNQISSYHTGLNNENKETYELRKKVESLEKRVENAFFSFINTNAENLICGVEVNTFKLDFSVGETICKTII